MKARPLPPSVAPAPEGEETGEHAIPELSTTQPVPAAIPVNPLPFVVAAAPAGDPEEAAPPGPPRDRASRPRRAPVFDLPGLGSTQPVRAVRLPPLAATPVLPFRLGGSVAAAPEPPEEDAFSWRSVPIEQPPMIGPLAHLLPEKGPPEEASPAPGLDPDGDTLPGLAAGAPGPAPVVEDGEGGALNTADAPDAPEPSNAKEAAPRDPASLPIDACARTAARLDYRPSERDTILDEDGFTGAEWEAAGEHWERAIRAEVTRGRTALLAAYDEAYVRSLEAERGPLTADTYAVLVVAAERGHLRESLDAERVPPEAYVRVERVWLRRTLSAPALADRTRDAIERARDA